MALNMQQSVNNMRRRKKKSVEYFVDVFKVRAELGEGRVLKAL